MVLLHKIKKHFELLEPGDRMILTTVKDGVRLQKFEKELSDCPLYVIPIEHHFLFEEGGEFETLIRNFIKKYYQSGKIKSEWLYKKGQLDSKIEYDKEGYVNLEK